VSEVRDGSVSTWIFRPQDVGLKPSRFEDIAGEDPAFNADIFTKVLSGGAPAAREICCLNAGAGLYVAGAADSLADGMALADEAIRDGAALEMFRAYKAQSVAAGRRQ